MKPIVKSLQFAIPRDTIPGTVSLLKSIGRLGLGTGSAAYRLLDALGRIPERDAATLAFLHHLRTRAAQKRRALRKLWATAEKQVASKAKSKE